MMTGFHRKFVYHYLSMGQTGLHNCFPWGLNQPCFYRTLDLALWWDCVEIINTHLRSLIKKLVVQLSLQN